MIVQVRFEVESDAPRSWLLRQLERYVAFGGAVTASAEDGRVLAHLREVQADEDGICGELEILDGSLIGVSGLSLGVSYSREGEAEISEVFPVPALANVGS